jgi:hypothetical protein
MRNEIPNWIKFIILLVGLYLVVLGILLYYQRKRELYEEWLRKQEEISQLLKEQQRIIEMKLKWESIARRTLISLKLICFVLLLTFVYCLMHYLHQDILSAFLNSGGIITFAYVLLASMLRKRVLNLNEIQDLVEDRIKSYYFKIKNIQPDLIFQLDQVIADKRIEANNIRQKMLLLN